LYRIPGVVSFAKVRQYYEIVNVVVGKEEEEEEEEKTAASNCLLQSRDS
jgi:hypothetical protein